MSWPNGRQLRREARLDWDRRRARLHPAGLLAGFRREETASPGGWMGWSLEVSRTAGVDVESGGETT